MQPVIKRTLIKLKTIALIGNERFLYISFFLLVAIFAYESKTDCTRSFMKNPKSKDRMTSPTLRTK
jgi:hypothetical protein